MLVTALVGVIVAVGMVVVVPLGLRLMDDDQRRLGPISQVWPFAGALGAVSMLLDRGPFAVALASSYAAVTGWLAVLAVVRLARRRSLAPVELAVLTAMVAPVVAGSSLVAERGGYELLGFGMTTLALTVAHFHFAGFVAALVAALASASVGSVAARVSALTVPAGIAVVFLGYFTNDEVELAGAVVLTGGMWLLAWSLWREVAPMASRVSVRALFLVGAIALVVTMALALSWAAGQVWDAVPHLSLSWMAATHGVANAFGFAVCVLLGWRRLQLNPTPSSLNDHVQ